jgi:hypothetical protein
MPPIALSALAAPNAINRMPEKTLLAFRDHGKLAGTLPRDGGDCETVLADFRKAGIDLEQLASDLQSNGASPLMNRGKTYSVRSSPSVNGCKPFLIRMSPVAGACRLQPRSHAYHYVAKLSLLRCTAFFQLRERIALVTSQRNTVGTLTFCHARIEKLA